MRYAVFGLGRIGRVHARILLSQGQQVVALGDESLACAREACTELGLPADTPLFTSPLEMARACKALKVDCGVIASHSMSPEYAL